ncbi:MAG: PadR family transcriptional regulator [Bifidobacteriaceae bacterium]|nr:PadR family transcriptional regulator [Bifidobacteriaceae bacterium]
METEEWPAEWLRGALELAVLGAAARGTTYGYQLASRLADGGIGQIKGGTLYPLLGRLERDGLLEAHWGPGDGGPGRKYYDLTAAGADRLATLAETWRRFAARICDLTEGTTDNGSQPERRGRARRH